MDSSRQYGGISRSEFENLKSDASGAGVTFPDGDEGALAFRGVEGIARYTESAGTLEIRIVKRPFLIPDAFIWRLVESMVLPHAGGGIPPAAPPDR